MNNSVSKNDNNNHLYSFMKNKVTALATLKYYRLIY